MTLVRRPASSPARWLVYHLEVSASDRIFHALESSHAYGYSCQLLIKYQLQQRLSGVYYHAWFAREMNPVHNGPSSSPLRIYWEMDDAVKTGDANNSKLKDYRANLLAAVNQVRMKKELARVLRRGILKAPLEAFRPQIWRINLTRIRASRIRADRSKAGWDEQYISDLRKNEFTIIVE